MRQRLILTAIVLLSASGPADAASGRGGQLTLSVVDEKGAPLAVRMHLKSGKGKLPKFPQAVAWDDHLAFNGELTLKLPVGAYSFEIERGLEYLPRLGRFQIADFADDSKTIDLKRFVDLTTEGWWSGDLHVARPEQDIELLMQADDLHVASLVAPLKSPAKARSKKGAKSTAKLGAKPKGAFHDGAADALAGKGQPLVELPDQRVYYRLNQAIARPSGSLLLLNLAEPIDIGKLGGESPTALTLIDRAKLAGRAWVDVPKPTSWDLPVWIAAGKVSSIELASGQLCREKVLKDDDGQPRDRVLFPEPHGAGRWNEAIYYHLLNCGLRIPPSAGSASGVSPNPVGYNRVYVHLEGEFTWEKWWQGLRAGRVFVTNGPLIRPTVEGQLPGHVFQADAGQEVELEIGLTLSTREKVSYLEVIKNGKVAYDVRLDDWAKAGGKMPKLKFKESGWFLLRAVTDAQKTYRFASTGPYYVEIGYQKRVSKASTQLFLDWIENRAAQAKTPEDGEAADIAAMYQMARAYWQKLVEEANAD